MISAILSLLKLVTGAVCIGIGYYETNHNYGSNLYRYIRGCTFFVAGVMCIIWA